MNIFSLLILSVMAPSNIVICGLSKKSGRRKLNIEKPLNRDNLVYDDTRRICRLSQCPIIIWFYGDPTNHQTGLILVSLMRCIHKHIKKYLSHMNSGGSACFDHVKNIILWSTVFPDNEKRWTRCLVLFSVSFYGNRKQYVRAWPQYVSGEWTALFM